MYQSPMVSICMITYCHEKFIEQAINGVLMQECNFDYELIITNDSSPDSTDAVVNSIIKNHPKGKFIKYFKHEKNIGMMPNFIFALEKCQSGYIAICEGDDYWTDTLKLQKQVDYLNEHKECVGCFTDIDMLENENFETKALKEKHRRNHDANSIFYDLWIPTLTILFRKESLHFPLPKQFSKVFNGDIFLFYLLVQQGTLDYLNFVSGVYRQHENGVWSGVNTITQIEKRIATFVLIKEFFNQNSKIKKIVGDKIIANNWLKISFLFKERMFKNFIFSYVTFLIKNPVIAVKNGYHLLFKPN